MTLLKSFIFSPSGRTVDIQYFQGPSRGTAGLTHQAGFLYIGVPDIRIILLLLKQHVYNLIKHIQGSAVPQHPLP